MVSMGVLKLLRMETKVGQIANEIELKHITGQEIPKELITRLNMAMHDLEEEVKCMMYEATNTANVAKQVDDRSHNVQRKIAIRQLPTRAMA